ncbi:MAG: hypothetical protein J7501_10980 [Bdellovibrio sp.]|nr:hypothetical protein [Bdellovibrio sp.]
MAKFAGGLISSVISSLIISAIMFVVIFFAITGEFPPDFKRIKTSFVSLQQINQIHQQFQKIKNTGSDAEIDDIESLEKLNSQRAKLGSSLLGDGLPSAENVYDTKSDIRELRRQLMNLQNRVSILEDQQRSRNSK